MNDDLRNRMGFDYAQPSGSGSSSTGNAAKSRPERSRRAVQPDIPWQRLSTNTGTVEIFWQGTKIQAREGDTVATALLAAGISSTRNNPVSGEARAPFCMMGSCFECMVKVDGVTEQACMIAVREGMEISLVPVRVLP